MVGCIMGNEAWWHLEITLVLCVLAIFKPEVDWIEREFVMV